MQKRDWLEAPQPQAMNPTFKCMIFAAIGLKIGANVSCRQASVEYKLLLAKRPVRAASGCQDNFSSTASPRIG